MQFSRREKHMPMYRKTALVSAEQYHGPEFETLQANLPLVAPAGVSFVADLREGRQGWAPALQTLEGRHFLREKDWVVTNPAGERYNISDEVFRSTYEEVNAAPGAHDGCRNPAHGTPPGQ